jgi:hypothetical protein
MTVKMLIDTRDKARELIAAAGITTANVTDKQLAKLRKCINARMLASGNYRGSYKMHRQISLYMTCRTEQWDKREAVSFNSNGFVGIAGWADSSNTRPILDGIADWLEQSA